MKVKHIVRGGLVSQQKAKQARQNRRRATEAERSLWRKLKGNQLGGFHFRRQQVVRGFIVDFYCCEASLVVEVDGRSHRSMADYDRERAYVLEGVGHKVIWFSNEDLRRRLVLEEILAECERRRVPGAGGEEEVGARWSDT